MIKSCTSKRDVLSQNIPGDVKAAGHGMKLVSNAATYSNEIGVNVGTAATATQSSARIPRAAICSPSSLLKTSDGEMVRQLLTSIKKNAAPYISSLVTLC